MNWHRDYIGYFNTPSVANKRPNAVEVNNHRKTFSQKSNPIPYGDL